MGDSAEQQVRQLRDAPRQILDCLAFRVRQAAMLQDALWARAGWLAKPGNEAIATKFLTAAFQGWMFCRDNAAKCVQYTPDAGSTLGAGHQAWMMNAINPMPPRYTGVGWAKTRRRRRDVRGGR